MTLGVAVEGTGDKLYPDDALLRFKMSGSGTGAAPPSLIVEKSPPSENVENAVHLSGIKENLIREDRCVKIL